MDLKSRRISILPIGWLVATSICFADLSGWKIGIDPGHGGSDPGAVGPTGLQEKEVNLDASFGCRRGCRSSNALVYMTRTTDVYLSLAARANFMNANDVDRSICVHHNAVSDPTPNFHLTYVAVGQGWGTAGSMAFNIADRVTDYNGLGFGWSNISRPGVYEANFYMVVYTTMPSCLPEISFISNPAEEQRLYSNHYCYGNGRGIYYGLMDHLGGWTDGFAHMASDVGASANWRTAPLQGEGALFAAADAPTIVSSRPNPFNGTIVLSYELRVASYVKLEVFDVNGRSVGARHASPLCLVDGWREAGVHEVTFDGSGLPSGIYIARIMAGDFSQVQKLILLK